MIVTLKLNDSNHIIIKDLKDFLKINIEKLKEIYNIKTETKEDEKNFFDNIIIKDLSIISMDKKDITNKFNILNLNDLVKFIDNLENIIEDYHNEITINYQLSIEN